MASCIYAMEIYRLETAQGRLVGGTHLYFFMAYQWCPNVHTEYVLFSGHLYMSKSRHKIHEIKGHFEFVSFIHLPR